MRKKNWYLSGIMRVKNDVYLTKIICYCLSWLPTLTEKTLPGFGYMSHERHSTRTQKASYQFILALFENPFIKGTLFHIIQKQVKKKSALKSTMKVIDPPHGEKEKQYHHNTHALSFLRRFIYFIVSCEKIRQS